MAGFKSSSPHHKSPNERQSEYWPLAFSEVHFTLVLRPQYEGEEPVALDEGQSRLLEIFKIIRETPSGEFVKVTHSWVWGVCVYLPWGSGVD